MLNALIVFSNYVRAPLIQMLQHLTYRKLNTQGGEWILLILQENSTNKKLSERVKTLLFYENSIRVQLQRRVVLLLIFSETLKHLRRNIPKI